MPDDVQTQQCGVSLSFIHLALRLLRLTAASSPGRHNTNVWLSNFGAVCLRRCIGNLPAAAAAAVDAGRARRAVMIRDQSTLAARYICWQCEMQLDYNRVLLWKRLDNSQLRLDLHHAAVCAVVGLHPVLSRWADSKVLRISQKLFN